MMTKHGTGIEWTHIPGFKGETWNPIVGCSDISPGCRFCYAKRVAGLRLDGNPNTPQYAGTTQGSKTGPQWSGTINRTRDDKFIAPMKWRKPRAIFVNSMGDLFQLCSNRVINFGTSMPMYIAPKTANGIEQSSTIARLQMQAFRTDTGLAVTEDCFLQARR